LDGGDRKRAGRIVVMEQRNRGRLFSARMGGCSIRWWPNRRHRKPGLTWKRPPT